MPLAVDLSQAAASHELAQGIVDGMGEGLIIRPEGYAILPIAERLAGVLEPGLGPVVKSDRPVEQHSIEPAQFEIEVWLDLAVERYDVADAGLFEHGLGRRAIQRADRLIEAVVERLDALLIAADDKLFLKKVI